MTRRPPQARLAAGLQLGCVGLALMAWAGAGAERTPGAQTPWVALGLLAIVLSGAVNAAWLVRFRRLVGFRQQSVGERARLVRDRMAPVTQLDRPGADLVWPAVDGMAFYHRPGCALLDGRSPRGGRRSEHEAAGRRPCGWCRP